jgi:hypothetical protein
MAQTEAEIQREAEIDYAARMGVDIQTARAQMANRLVQDVRIMQKVNRVYRDAFSEKYPGQCEHILRLLCERLQAGLDKRANVDIANPDTWILTPAELADLTQAVYHMHLVRSSFQE